MGAINRKFFYDYARQHLFGGQLRQSQVDGMNAFLDRWEAHHAQDDHRWLAYILGTTHHETDRTMQPIEEYGRGTARRTRSPDSATTAAASSS